MRRLFGGRTARKHRATPADDQRVIEQMESLGWNMTEPRLIDNFLYFRSRDLADQALAACTQAGYEASVGPAPDGRSWSVIARVRRVVTLEAITAQRNELTGIAEQFRGEYDGWGVGQ